MTSSAMKNHNESICQKNDPIVVGNNHQHHFLKILTHCPRIFLILTAVKLLLILFASGILKLCQKDTCLTVCFICGVIVSFLALMR
jgi:hypothetical protein